MPACTSESLSRLWQNGTSRESVRAGLDSASGSFPSSPNSSSPPTTSPIATLRRARSATPSSSFFQKEPFKIKSKWRSTQALVPPKQQKSMLVTLIGWYPCFLLHALQAAVTMLLPIAFIQTLLSLPKMWFSMWFWMFWKAFDLPLTVFKWIVTFLNTPTLEFARKKRTVLISGGSTIQALHLARNFYCAGARVIVCEIEGAFALARFSTAVSKFYTLPNPLDDTRAYVQELCAIVEKEHAAYYVPVSSTSSAYYDAMAKPMLELLGCTCICPGAKEVLLLDDTLEFLRKCADMALPTPAFFPVASKEKLVSMYENGVLRTGRHIMNSCGSLGARDRLKIVLPTSVSDLKMPDMNETRPWVVVQDVPGNRYITCTTVKQSEVVANVTCRVDENKCLVPIEHKEIEEWLRHFFAKLQLLRPVTGHFSFILKVPESSMSILPFNCKVGVSLPYICHTSVHPRILWRPCKHFSRQNSGPLVIDRGHYLMHQAVLNTMQRPSVKSVTRFIGTVLDKREALFVFWDPLPYCAYYHMQLPFKNITRFLHRKRFPGTMAAPVH